MHNVPVDDVKEVFDDGNLLEHKLHFPIHVLLKQMDKSRIQQFKMTQVIQVKLVILVKQAIR